jgi:valyl-tRNA synthetase
MVDLNAEKARLSKEMEGLEREIARLTQRLGDGQFTSKAPPAVVDKEKARLEEYRSKFARMQTELQQLG